jgi:hypothetical protein
MIGRHTDSKDCKNIQIYNKGGSDRMTLQEYEAQGGCIGCLFYGIVDADERKACTFHWFDDESDDWEMGKNCDEIA